VEETGKAVQIETLVAKPEKVMGKVEEKTIDNLYSSHFPQSPFGSGVEVKEEHIIELEQMKTEYVKPSQPIPTHPPKISEKQPEKQPTTQLEKQPENQPENQPETQPGKQPGKQQEKQPVKQPEKQQEKQPEKKAGKTICKTARKTTQTT